MYNPLFVSEHSVEIVNINFLDLDSNTVIHWICMQGRSQSQTLNPGWARKQHFLNFSSFSYTFSIFPQFFFIFFLNLRLRVGGPEKALATPLFVCIHALLVKLWSCYMMQQSIAMWSTICKLSKFDNKPAKFIARPSVWSHHYHTVNQSTMYRITYLHKKSLQFIANL